MTLLQVNQKLEHIAEELSRKIIEHQKVDLAYQLRYWHLISHSGMGTILLKESEANLTCQQEGLLEPVYILRAQVKSLYSQKDCYMVIASNLRVPNQLSQ